MHRVFCAVVVFLHIEPLKFYVTQNFHNVTPQPIYPAIETSYDLENMDALNEVIILFQKTTKFVLAVQRYRLLYCYILYKSEFLITCPMCNIYMFLLIIVYRKKMLVICLVYMQNCICHIELKDRSYEHPTLWNKLLFKIFY